jgi:hypothetical protein
VIEPDEASRERESAALRFVVARAAHHASAERAVATDRRRLAGGWEPRFVAQGARLEEMVRLYQELGYEVAADLVRPEDVAPGCQGCRVLIGMDFRMIYTRRAGSGVDQAIGS